MSESAYDAWHERLVPDDGETNPWHLMVEDALPPRLDGLEVLEIGCGRGGFSRRLARRGNPKRVVGADFSTVAIEKAMGVLSESAVLEFRRMDIQAIDLPDRSVDVVVSCETIEHVPEPQVALSELFRVLRPGGTLYLTVPNYLGTMGLYRVYLRLRGTPYTEAGQPINHPLLFPVVRGWLKQAGFERVSSRTVGHYVPVPGRPPVRLSALDGALLKPFGLHALLVARKPR